MPQVIVISIAGLMLLFYHFRLVRFFRALTFILFAIFIYSFVFQTIDLIWVWLHPNWGLIEIDGKLVRTGMDHSGLFIGFISLIISFVSSILHLNLNKNKSTTPEYHLAIGTIVSVAIVFLYLEII